MPWGKYRKIGKFFCSNKKKVTKKDKDGNENESVINISYKIKFIDSAGIMTTLLPNLVDNLKE